MKKKTRTPRTDRQRVVDKIVRLLMPFPQARRAKILQAAALLLDDGDDDESDESWMKVNDEDEKESD